MARTAQQRRRSSQCGVSKPRTEGLQRFVIRGGKMVSLRNLFDGLYEVDAFYK